MFALDSLRPVWSFIFGTERKRTAKPLEVAAHLRSLSPADAALLKGHGYVPVMATPAAVEPTVQEEPAATEIEATSPGSIQTLPWPLLRNSGTFEAEHHKTAIALAASAALLALEMREKQSAMRMRTEPALDSTEINFETTEPAAFSHLAAKLAAVARHNQPVARGSSHAMLKEASVRASEQSNARRVNRRIKQSGLREAAVRTPAVVIDLASVRTSKRNALITRAA